MAIDKSLISFYNSLCQTLRDLMPDAYLANIVIDVSSRTFRLYSSDHDYKEEHCETQEAFMNVLEFVRKTVPDELISYDYCYVNQN